MNQNKIYHVIGLMSGTSLDGLDIAYCTFDLYDSKNINFKIIHAETIDYEQDIKNIFLSLENCNAVYFSEMDRKMGNYFGIKTKEFIQKYTISNIDFVASHGHTIFHQPQKYFTTQVGHGASLAAACELPVICDFRSLDVALGGQGAPLVPIGDQFLFSEFSHCLNLGGIANISFNDEFGTRIAFDICPCNMPMNRLMNTIGKEFDENGKLATSGTIHFETLQKLNFLEFYAQNPPKSLGKEWVDAEFMPLINAINISIADKLATICEHVAIQISNYIKSADNELFITGGGALNSFLIERIKFHSKGKVIIPDEKILKFKEALIFAYLGVLRWIQQPNTLSSVTGARKNSIGGCVYLG